MLRSRVCRTSPAYGFGWLIGEIHDQPLYVHTGDNPGYMFLQRHRPSAEARVILLTNDETTDIYTPAMQLLEAAVSSCRVAGQARKSTRTYL